MMGKVDIAATILDIALKETPLKALEERADIPHKVLDEHLKTLESKHLIGISKRDKKVKTTERGMQFLALYNSIHSKYLTVRA